MATHPPRKPTASRFRRILNIVLLTVIGLAALMGGAVWWLWSSDPAYWRANAALHEATPTPQLRRTAADLESRVNYEVTHLTPRGAPATRRVVLPIDEVNVWLSQSMPRWLESLDVAWPPQVTGVMATVEGDRIVGAFRLTTDRFDRVVSVVLRPWVDEDGAGRVVLEGVRIGRLPAPASVLMERLPEHARGQVGAWLNGRPFEPVFPIDAARQARVLGIQIEPDRLIVDLEVERRTPYH